MSQAYISHLASIPPDSLTNIGVRVVVIGCGEWDVIPFYKGVEKTPGHLHLQVKHHHRTVPIFRHDWLQGRYLCRLIQGNLSGT